MHMGGETKAAVEKAREQVAKYNWGRPKGNYFLPPVQLESNNIAIKGVARFYGAKKKTYNYNSNSLLMGPLCTHFPISISARCARFFGKGAKLPGLNTLDFLRVQNTASKVPFFNSAMAGHFLMT
ncbi:hypothetical protein NQ317_007523 [Molorchus minor]|uniref:Uncharacterized protein n=1 Tax=Molorchus minor TaxID=1323400 RepID=A0ABQ9J3Q8_9CUCU|nr:hypothetical protein NQ317_007523 [Molorchus minor]